MSRIFRLRLRRSAASMPRAFSGASTFSRTVSQGKSAKLWKTMETLTSAVAIGFSCQYTWPAEGAERPVSMRSRVDLPEPDGPSSATISPAHNGEVGRRDHLDAVLARLRIVLLNTFGAYDGWLHRSFLIVSEGVE